MPGKTNTEDVERELDPQVDGVTPSRDEDGNVNLDADTFFLQLKENRFEITSGSNVPPKAAEAAAQAIAVVEQLVGENFVPTVLPGWTLDDMIDDATRRLGHVKERDQVADLVIKGIHQRCTDSKGLNATMHGRATLDPWENGHEDGFSTQLIWFEVNPANASMIARGRHACMAFVPATIRYTQFRNVWREQGSWFTDVKSEREDDRVPGYLGITHFFKSYADMKLHMKSVQQATRDYESLSRAILLGQYTDDPVQRVVLGTQDGETVRSAPDQAPF